MSDQPAALYLVWDWRPDLRDQRLVDALSVSLPWQHALIIVKFIRQTCFALQHEHRYSLGTVLFADGVITISY
jgi:hypothetical protein